MKVFVTKADGSKQLFDKNKVARTCIRMGASPQLALKVAEKIERRVYEGMPTKKILQLIFLFLRKDKPSVGHLVDLRKGLSLMSPKPEFEMFVQVLLAKNGFEVRSNHVLKGRCGEHEVDAIAKKDGVTYFVEVKHHLSYHALTGLDESRIARAVLEDVSEGYQMGRTEVKIDKAMIVTNTRYSRHALEYGRCRGILQIGWNYPANHGLEDMIEEKNLYPLSCLRGLRGADRMKLVNQDIVLVSQLLAEDQFTLAKKTGLPRATVEGIVAKARSSINS
ncbi:MAG: restriction endonuclease [Candidatus Bathyarchaeota archaeon]|nr:restriction endonuclease [Candidatus Bathyarchaeota archaeon]